MNQPDRNLQTKPTIVLVHGAWHGPWCWEENVAPALRELGYPVISVELPNHGNPGSPKRFWRTIASYVAHVRGVLDSTVGKTVLVGHSMGGLVVQRVLENTVDTNDVTAAVLVGSIPPKGGLGTVLRILRDDPLGTLKTLLGATMWPLVSDRDRARRLFFTDDATDELVDTALARLQNESVLALLGMIGRRPKPGKVTTPVSVIHGQLDGVFTTPEQAALAESYDTERQEVSGAGHDLMLDIRWPLLVEHIDRVAS